MKRKFNLVYVLNLIGILSMILINVLANIIPLNNVETGEISAEYSNLFTPAGYTFIIWSIIYLGLIGFIVYQFFPSYHQPHSEAQNIVNLLGIAVFLNCLANGMWIYAWHYKQFHLTIILMFLILSTLLGINKRLWKYEQSVSHTSKGYHWLVKLPFGLYLGWICVASIANMAVYFKFMSWNFIGIGETTLAITMVIASGALAILLLLKWHNIPAVCAIVWGIVGIYMKQQHLNDSYSLYMLVALATVAIIMLLSILRTNLKTNNL